MFPELQIKVEDGEIGENAEGAKDVKKKDSSEAVIADHSDRRLSNSQQSGWLRRDGNHGAAKKVTFKSHLPTSVDHNSLLSLIVAFWLGF